MAVAPCINSILFKEVLTLVYSRDLFTCLFPHCKLHESRACFNFPVLQYLVHVRYLIGAEFNRMNRKLCSGWDNLGGQSPWDLEIITC